MYNLTTHPSFTLLDYQNYFCKWKWTICVITTVSMSIRTRRGKRHVTFGYTYMHTHLHMHACSPHTRLSALPGCLEWKHSQGWWGKPGKHFFRHKQKNTSLVCCYCTVLGRCFVCSDNSRTFKWRPGTEPETRAHHWRWGEKVYRPPCVCVCLFVCVSLSVYLCVLSLAGTPSLITSHDYKVREQVGPCVCVWGGPCVTV